MHRRDVLAPRDMPRRRSAGTEASRIALLHALAHIELNAIDLAWDIIARFTGEKLPGAFYDDWVTVAAEEARHFELLAMRLSDLGAAYGDLPVSAAAIPIVAKRSLRAEACANRRFSKASPDCVARTAANSRSRPRMRSVSRSVAPARAGWCVRISTGSRRAFRPM